MTDHPKRPVATLDMAKAEFEASWRQWLAWTKLREWSDEATN